MHIWQIMFLKKEEKKAILMNSHIQQVKQPQLLNEKL